MNETGRHGRRSGAGRGCALASCLELGRGMSRQTEAERNGLLCHGPKALPTCRIQAGDSEAWWWWRLDYLP